MVHVAPLAEGREVSVRVVGRVVIAMSGGQDHSGRSYRLQHVIHLDGEANNPAFPIAPGTDLGVPPAAVTKMPDGLPMWTPAAFTAPFGAAKADHRRQLRPVDGVEEAVLAPDRHGQCAGLAPT